MKNKLRFLACLGTSLLMPMTAFAASGWTENVPVAELTPTNQERFLVKLHISKNPAGCKNKEMFYLEYGASGSEQMFHTLLEAVVSEKNVRVYVTGKCELNGYSEISAVSIIP